MHIKSLASSLLLSFLTSRPHLPLVQKMAFAVWMCSLSESQNEQPSRICESSASSKIQSISLCVFFFESDFHKRVSEIRMTVFYETRRINSKKTMVSLYMVDGLN
jgi:hypothetical protein